MKLVIPIKLLTTTIIIVAAGLAGFLFLINSERKPQILEKLGLIVVSPTPTPTPTPSPTLTPTPTPTPTPDKQNIVQRVGQLIDLPEDETPIVTTVSDPEKLREQPFFAKAKIGDKVLIYKKAKKAVLYDPLADKILEVGPLIKSTAGENGNGR